MSGWWLIWLASLSAQLSLNYTTLTPEQTAHMLRDSGARAIFVSADRHLEKVFSVLESTAVEKVVVMDDVTDGRALRMSELMSVPAEVDLISPGREVQPSDLATIIYTSGNNGYAEGRNADPRQHDGKYNRILPRLWILCGNALHMISPSFACDSARG